MSDDSKTHPPGGRQLEFSRSRFAASERQLEPLSNEDYEATDEEFDQQVDEIEDYPVYTDEVADYQPAPEDLFAEADDTEPPASWEESSVEAAMRWHDEDGATADSEAGTESPDDLASDEYDAEPYYDDVTEDEPAYHAGDSETTSTSSSRLNLEQLSELDTELDEFTDEANTRRPAQIPLGLLATAVVALLLLAAGGYGVMQQRAEMQEEIRLLQSRLATAGAIDAAGDTSSDTRVADLEQALAGLEQSNRGLQMDNAALEEKLAALQATRRLSEAPSESADQSTGAAGRTVMEKGAEPAPEQIAASKPAAVEASDSLPVAAPVEAKVNATAPESQPVVPAQAPTGPWFVNFAAYSREGDARARADSLKVSAGIVRLLPVEVDGRTLYRVRITGLSDRSRADALARELESNYGVSRLWVGKN